ncbi:MAG: helix-turn-helix domain-containing protein [Alistipes sp.]
MLEKDFIISDRIEELPLPKTPLFIGFSVIGLCQRGWADFTVRGQAHRVTENKMLILFPQQAVSLMDYSPDFAFTFFVVPQTLFHDVFSMMRRFTPHFFFFMQEHYAFDLTNGDRVEDFKRFCSLLKRRANVPEVELRRELIIHTLATLYMDLYQYYKGATRQTTFMPNQRKEELTYKFFGLVAANYIAHKDVAFYADKMNITPTYLTIVVKESCGLSAKEWLVEFITQKIKTELRNPQFNMQEIALELNFPTQTAMNRFFRNYTKMSLTEYRRSTTP